jgi:hypothetical protein
MGGGGGGRISFKSPRLSQARYISLDSTYNMVASNENYATISTYARAWTLIFNNMYIVHSNAF